MEQAKLNQLKKTAAQIRLDILEGVHAASSGHPGGSLSIADIITYLYYEEMNVNPADPKWEDRDRLVLSKGHTAPALYAVLAEKGYFPREELKKLRQVDSFLQGHPDMKGTPGVDMTTVPVKDRNEIVELVVSGKHCCFPDLTFFTLTVTDDRVGTERFSIDLCRESHSARSREAKSE